MNIIIEFFNINAANILMTSISLARMIIPPFLIVIALMIIVVIPQKKHRAWLTMLTTELKLGAIISTSNGLSGTIFLIQKNTVIIESCDGEKIEILKQTIIKISHEKI